MSKKHVDKQGKVKPTAVKKRDPQAEQASQAPKQLNESSLTQLQQTVGNTAVQNLIVQRKAQGPQALEEETADNIRQAKRQEGEKLDPATAQQASQVMGHNMQGVNVHTDSQADELTQQVGAKAFTTGNDVFFRQGEYDPGSEQGQELLGHELTHVAQQSKGSQQVSAKADEAHSDQMTVNDPADKYEAEADQMAAQFVGHTKAQASVTGGGDTAVQRQEEDEQLQMQEEDELQMQENEEEQLQMQEEDELQMQENEEEQLQMQEEDELQMQENEEEQLQMQEEDELQMQENEEEQLQMQEEDELQMQENEEEQLQMQEEDELQMQENEEEQLQMQEMPEEEMNSGD